MITTLINPKQIIAARVAKELRDGDVVNLGIGLPTMVPNYLPEDVNVILAIRKWIYWPWTFRR